LYVAKISQLLRRHVRERTRHLARHRDPAHTRIGETLRQAKVSQLRDEVLRATSNENVLVLEVAMNVALGVCERECVERLRDDRNAVFVRQSPTVIFSKLRSISAIDEFSDEINDAIVCAAIDELDDVLVLQRCSDVDLTHEAFHSFVTDGKLRQQRFDRNWASGFLLASEHHATHAAASEQPHSVVTRNCLRRTLELYATVFTKKRQVLIRR